MQIVWRTIESENYSKKLTKKITEGQIKNVNWHGTVGSGSILWHANTCNGNHKYSATHSKSSEYFCYQVHFIWWLKDLSSSLAHNFVLMDNDSISCVCTIHHVVVVVVATWYTKASVRVTDVKKLFLFFVLFSLWMIHRRDILTFGRVRGCHFKNLLCVLLLILELLLIYRNVIIPSPALLDIW